MKKTLLLLTIVTFLAVGAFAGGICPLITVDEQGQGKLDFSVCFAGGATNSLTGVVQSDPGPGGLANVLTYNLLGPPSLIAGDLRIFDTNGIFSDVVRFNPADTGNPGYPASLLFYSDPVGGVYDSLADIYSPPTSYYTNVLNLTEAEVGGVSSVLYTPTDGQPGFVPGYAVSYDLISSTPEPCTLMLLGSFLGLGGLLRRRR